MPPPPHSPPAQQLHTRTAAASPLTGTEQLRRRRAIAHPMQMSRPPPASHWSAQPLSALSLVSPAPRRPPIGYLFLAPEAGSRVRALRAAAARPAAPFASWKIPVRRGRSWAQAPPPRRGPRVFMAGEPGCVGTTRATLGTLLLEPATSTGLFCWRVRAKPTAPLCTYTWGAPVVHVPLYTYTRTLVGGEGRNLTHLLSLKLEAEP